MNTHRSQENYQQKFKVVRTEKTTSLLQFKVGN